MGTNLFPEAYEDLVNEDIEWLQKNTEPCIERGHIVQLLKASVKEYRDRGYMEAMTGERNVSKGDSAND